MQSFATNVCLIASLLLFGTLFVNGSQISFPNYYTVDLQITNKLTNEIFYAKLSYDGVSTYNRYRYDFQYSESYVNSTIYLQVKEAPTTRIYNFIMFTLDRTAFGGCSSIQVAPYEFKWRDVSLNRLLPLDQLIFFNGNKTGTAVIRGSTCDMYSNTFVDSTGTTWNINQYLLASAWTSIGRKNGTVLFSADAIATRNGQVIVNQRIDFVNMVTAFIPKSTWDVPSVCPNVPIPDNPLDPVRDGYISPVVAAIILLLAATVISITSVLFGIIVGFMVYRLELGKPWFEYLNADAIKSILTKENIIGSEGQKL